MIHKKSKIKILLAGTPNFSVLTFSKIIENFEVVGIIAQPTRPIGRNLLMIDPPTVMLGKHYQINIFQPLKIEDIYDDLKKLDFDIFITMAYGQIIPEKILSLAKKGSYNIHGSLLPKYRGASPIQYALINGDKETGITFMEMSKKMDSGDMIFQEVIPINEEDNYDSILKKMSEVSSTKISSWIEKIIKNDYKKIKQDDSYATYCPKITKNDEKLNLDTMEKTLNKIRALSSVPGAYIFLKDEYQEKFNNLGHKRVKIFKATKNLIKNTIQIKCTDGVLYAIEYQIEGKRKVSLDI